MRSSTSGLVARVEITLAADVGVAVLDVLGRLAADVVVAELAHGHTCAPHRDRSITNSAAGIDEPFTDQPASEDDARRTVESVKLIVGADLGDLGRMTPGQPDVVAERIRVEQRAQAAGARPSPAAGRPVDLSVGDGIDIDTSEPA